ncbi:MAG TPA: hypothetical protein VF867_00700 [Arthrobacter sp.]
MSTQADTATVADVPAVLTISSGIWLVLGALGTVWTLMGLLMVLAFSGMVAPQTYLPALALYLASGAVFVTAAVLAVLLRRGRRPARIVLSAYVVILPALLFLPGGPPPGGIPWQVVLLSPAGGVGMLAVAATVLMWLPPANAYFARRAAHSLETPANSEPPSRRVPRPVTAAGWILLVAGVVAALQAALGLVLFVSTLGSGGNTTPALVLWLTLAAAAAADLVCVNPVRRGKPFARPIVTVIPLAGLTLVVLATIAGVSSLPAGSPGAAGGLAPAIFLTVFSQGLPLLAGLVAAVLVWLPSARRYFRRGAEALPAGTTGS